MSALAMSTRPICGASHLVKAHLAGGLAAAGIHVIDSMIHLLGPISSVFAQSDRLVNEIDHDDTTSMLLRFYRGATGYVATMTATARIFRIQVFGEKGWLELSGQNQLTWMPVDGVADIRTYPEVSTEKLKLEAFAEAINSRTAFQVPPDEIINGIAVFAGVLASLNSGGQITV